MGPIFQPLWFEVWLTVQICSDSSSHEALRQGVPAAAATSTQQKMLSTEVEAAAFQRTGRDQVF